MGTPETESFTDHDLTGATFERVHLTGARFHHVDLSGAVFAGVDFSGAVIRDSQMSGVEISDVDSLLVNGIDVVPLVEAELDRRHPERRELHPTDAAGYRRAWEVIEQLWAPTVERARGLDPALLHEQVGGEWSFVQTLRHLAYATDVWIARVLLGDPKPWHPLDLPFDSMTPHPDVPWDREARPSLDEVLALRADRMGLVRRTLADLTDDRLAGTTTPVEGGGWPPAEAFPVREPFDVVLNEEWWHHRYAVRDLDALTGSPESD